MVSEVTMYIRVLFARGVIALVVCSKDVSSL